VLVGRRAWGAVHGGGLRAREGWRRGHAQCGYWPGNGAVDGWPGAVFRRDWRGCAPTESFLDVRWSLRYIARAMSRHVLILYALNIGLLIIYLLFSDTYFSFVV
jgi:hypothetical protein